MELVDGSACELVDVFLGGLNVDVLAGPVATPLDLAWAPTAVPLAVANDVAWGAGAALDLACTWVPTALALAAALAPGCYKSRNNVKLHELNYL